MMFYTLINLFLSAILSLAKLRFSDTPKQVVTKSQKRSLALSLADFFLSTYCQANVYSCISNVTVDNENGILFLMAQNDQSLAQNDPRQNRSVSESKFFDHLNLCGSKKMVNVLKISGISISKF